MNDEDFPTTLVGAVRYFSDEAVCRNFLARLRWPDGVQCVDCGTDRVGTVTRRATGSVIYRCRACRKEFSVKKGTIFEDSAIPLSKWLPAMWLYSAGKKGRSSHQLARDLGVTQKTAWFMSHRIRLAMDSDGFGGSFSGEVEADETFMGGKERFKHGDRKRPQPWGPLGKVAVMGLLERHGEGASQIRARMVPTRRKGIIHTEVRRNVEQGSRLYTDALQSYVGLADEYVHEVIDHSEAYVRERVHTNGLENFWSLFKRVIYGTHHSVDPVHLDRYLDENVLRFNTRKMADADRFTMTAGRADGRRITYRELIGKAAAVA